MIKLAQIITISALSFMFAACNNGGAKSIKFETKQDSISYALGSVQTHGMMQQLGQFGVKEFIDTDWFLKGAKDNLSEGSTVMDEKTGNEFLQKLMSQIQMDSTFVLPEASKGEELQNSTDSMSYAFGLSLMIGVERGVEQLQLEGINKKLSYTGIKDVMTDTAKIAHQTGIAMLNELVSEAQEKQRGEMMQKQKEQEKENEVKFADIKKAGEGFLAQNKNKPGVKVTESGLQYKVLKEGNGPKPGPQDKVKVHYTGKLIDGTVFDSSVERGEPAEFGVTQVISGWTEALQMMKVGSKWEVYIPYDLAYGGHQRGQHIKPFSALVFEVELLEIVE